MHFSGTAKFAVAVSALTLTIAHAPLAHAAGELSPEEVYSVMHSQVREVLGLNTGGSGEYWLSLSIVGSIADDSDQAWVNDLANWCPTASPVIEVFGQVPKLDAVYEQVVLQSVGPKRDYTVKYAQARRIIMDDSGNRTPKYAKYVEYRDKVDAEWKKYAAATTAAERAAALKAINGLRADWSAGGYKAEVDRALTTMMTEEYIVGDGRTLARQNTLENYRAMGLPGEEVGLGGYVSPLSRFQPKPADWSDSDGWVKVSLDDETVRKSYSSSGSSSSGFGGLNLGFLTAVGAAGGGNSSESSVTRVYKLSTTMEIMRVRIGRAWLDESLLLSPNSWTWRKDAATAEYPLVAVDRAPTGVPLAPYPSVYQNREIACPLLPLELIVAPNRSVTATTSRADFNRVTTSGSSAGGGSFLGIFGGGRSRKWTTTKVNEDTDNVTFKVEAPGIAVIGVLSQVLKRTPNPNPAEAWPTEAWTPN